jgi:subtilisin family serine protease
VSRLLGFRLSSEWATLLFIPINRKQVMKTILAFVLALLWVLCQAQSQQSIQAQQPQQQKWAKGRLLAQTNEDVTESMLTETLTAHGAKARRIGKTDLFIIDLPPQASETALQAMLKRNPHFRFVELDMAVRPVVLTNDPYLSNEWHIPKIGAPAAWDDTLGSGVTIAILDTGVDGAHPDLAANMVAGWNFFDNNSNTAPVAGHGTWVAGSAAAVANNAIGVIGVAGQAKIMPIRVTDTTGLGYWSMISQGIVYAIDHGARVANVSFENMLLSSSILGAAQYMKDRNGLVAVAIGNTGTDPGFIPSTSVIAVSATDASDVVTSWSSFGAAVSIAAPGNYIWTTSPGGGYTQGIGTSFSSPVVAGAIALMMAVNPLLGSYQIESLLFANALDLGTAGRDVKYGHGRVDAARAVAAAKDFIDSVAPVVAITSPLNGSTVSGRSTWINIQSTDNSPVSGITNQLLIDGVLVASGAGSLLNYKWNTRHERQGPHLIRAVASDLSGNSSFVQITVNR